MKLKKLNINNIASLSKGEIDFTAAPLSEAPIFLICGETGSGKTTILDAICLALYNKTPRLSNGSSKEETRYEDSGNEIDINKANQLLKKGEKEGSISLVFEGADGKEYHADWSCKISSRAHNLEKEEWSVTDPSGKSVSLSSRNKEIMEEIIGMDFNQFCKTSMLAQGEFTRFLKADTDDKSAILEKITGTEIYAKIGEKIHDRQLDAKRERDTAKSLLEGITILPDTEIEKLMTEMDDIKKEIEVNNAKVAKLEGLLKAFDEISRADRDHNDACSSRGEGKKTFSELCNGIAFDENSLGDKEQELKSKEEFLKAKESLAEMFTNVQTIQKDLSTILKKENEKRDKEAEAAKEDEALTVLKKTQAEIDAKLKTAKDELEIKRNILRKAEEDLAALLPEKVDEERVSISESQDRLNSAEISWGTIANNETILEGKITEIQGLHKNISSASKDIEGLKTAKAAAEEEYLKAKDLYDRQSVSTEEFVRDLRERLRKMGADECPVCHSKISALTTDEQEQNVLRPIREHMELRKKDYDKASGDLTSAETALDVKKKALGNAEVIMHDLEKSIKDDKISFFENYPELQSPDGKTPKETISAAKEILTTAKEANEKALSAIKAQRDSVSAARNDADNYEKSVLKPMDKEASELLNKITGSLGRKEAAVRAAESAGHEAEEALAEARKLILYPDWEKRWREDNVSFSASLSADAAEYAEILKDKADLISSMKALEASMDIAREQRDEILKSNADFAPENIVALQFEGNAAVAWGVLKQSVEDCNAKISAAQQSASVNHAFLAAAFAEDDTLPQTKEEVEIAKAGLKISVDAENGRLGAINQIIADNEKQKEQLGNRQKDFDLKDRVYNNWSSLNTLFGGEDGKNFKKVAQSYIMQDILDHANYYLAKISGRYELLAQPGSLIILVKDAESGAIRSGNTLSGGEGFVVSLSLALGLSSLAESSISVDTIFIDEGFGTLSQDWLNSVMNTLEKLNSTSGKRIGMITHMEELKGRIPVYINVKRTDATSSVTEVYPKV